MNNCSYQLYLSYCHSDSQLYSALWDHMDCITPGFLCCPLLLSSIFPSIRGWNVWMASLTQWTWVWANSGIYWRTDKPGMLLSMWSQNQKLLCGWTTIKLRKVAWQKSTCKNIVPLHNSQKQLENKNSKFI